MTGAQSDLMHQAAVAAKELYQQMGATPTWRKLMDALERVWEEEDS